MGKPATAGGDIPLSLYVHLPWCVRKCPYCDFNSHEAGAGLPAEARYTDALIRDLRHQRPQAGERPLHSIFFGGGTPSLFGAAALGRFLAAVRAEFDLEPGIEITLEANPGTVEAERFGAYRALGINRLSLGMQSLSDRMLKKLGRIHSAAEAMAAVATTRAAGFENFNLDCMYALPGQATAEALDDLRGLLALAPAHLSWYQLTIEPNTLFHHQPPPLPGEESVEEMEQAAGPLFARHGFERYEVSAWCPPGRESRHNLNYWRFGDYLGVGAGAHGKLTDPASGRIVRAARHRLPERYMQLAGNDEVAVQRREPVGDDLVFEFMLNALRLRRGFSLELFRQRTGLSPACLERGLETAVARGLLSRTNDHLQPTARGFVYLNDLVGLFLAAERMPARASV